MDGKDIVVIWIPGGDIRPYKCPVSFPTERSRHGEKAYYIRKMASTIKAGPQEERPQDADGVIVMFQRLSGFLKSYRRVRPKAA